ncbi:MAG: biotin--[acetyl-CoA-carboxylase] ligase [Bacteroidales bacterium]|nr:biotin--[acetyl-CoA-carboxylase] ligase [Bacteroidales bacterium]
MKNFDLYNKLKRYDILASTNDLAVQLAISGDAVEGTVIMADFQTKGKGQRNSQWISEKGNNLTFSILLFPAFLNPAGNFFLSMALSLGIIDMLHSYKINAGIKWPNDIYTGKGKIAGILIENAIQVDKIRYSVLGTGLNVNQVIFPEDIPNPTSMRIEIKTVHHLETVLKRSLESIEKWFIQLYEQNFDEIKRRYEQQLLFRGQVREFYADDRVFSGTIKGINDAGQLIITDRFNKTRTFNFKEVTYII